MPIATLLQKLYAAFDNSAAAKAARKRRRKAAAGNRFAGGGSPRSLQASPIQPAAGGAMGQEIRRLEQANDLLRKQEGPEEDDDGDNETPIKVAGGLSLDASGAVYVGAKRHAVAKHQQQQGGASPGADSAC